MHRECIYCPNDSRNPSMSFDARGMCQVCAAIKPRKSVLGLTSEMEFLFNKKAMIGMSGGKDSTATAWMAKKLGIELMGFTFDTGYYPEHIFPRAKKYAEELQIPHEVIDIRKYVKPWIRDCYEMTAELYDHPLDREDALCLYALNREHYSVKDQTVMPFIRACQICRKVVVPAYYQEAIARGAQVVILGMNEWTHLTGNNNTSGLRQLKPWPNLPPIWIAHLPYLMGWTVDRTRRAVMEMGWTLPPDEGFVETNSNSCLFARATERQAFNMLGFHPDTTRLAREVTAGFVSRDVAVKSLERVRDSDKTVRQTLQDAEIIR